MGSMRQYYSAVVERNVVFEEIFHSEPYEVGWATELIIFVRSLDGAGDGAVEVEISPDGIRWCKEGTTFELPTATDAVTFGKVSHFGNWVRLSGRTKKKFKALITFSMKE